MAKIKRQQNLVHGLKNPMGGIRGAATLLYLELDNAELKEYTNIILKEMDRIFSRVDELPNLLLDDNESILRSIEFPPEYKSAGVSLLTYFGEVIQQKYPDSDVTFRIEQRDNIVTLIVMANDRELERIEQLLSDYGQVIEGTKPVSEFLANPMQQTQLAHKLDMAELELKMTRQLYQQYNSLQNERIEALEGQVSVLGKMLNESLKSIPDIDQILKIIEPYKKIDRNIAKALKMLSKNLVDNPTNKNREETKSALLLVKKSQPSLFQEIYDVFKGTISGAGGNVVSSWVMAILNALPK